MYIFQYFFLLRLSLQGRIDKKDLNYIYSELGDNLEKYVKAKKRLVMATKIIILKGFGLKKMKQESCLFEIYNDLQKSFLESCDLTSINVPCSKDKIELMQINIKKLINYYCEISGIDEKRKEKSILLDLIYKLQAILLEDNPAWVKENINYIKHCIEQFSKMLNPEEYEVYLDIISKIKHEDLVEL